MNTEIELQNQKVRGLLKLIKENPELRILPMVYQEIVEDGFSYWAGAFGESKIDFIWNNGERIYFKSDDEEQLIEDEIDNIESAAQLFITTALHESHPLYRPIEVQAKERVENYDWEKVIVVYIELP